MVHVLTNGDYRLRTARSNDLEPGSLVEVQAEIARQGRDDSALETAVRRLSLEPGVSSFYGSVAQDRDTPLASTGEG